ncbi:MAG: hypothetical protein AUG51_15565 [Acidobacteria bacterium 13_1_20CM_3_53_8]|nr:MAG: hypothetical protein AUG51_15565 [Acidobacteria bacterium 13_1_20CM_3_53_8]
MRQLKLFVLLTFIGLAALVKMALLAQPVAAKPAFMDRYDHDPLAKANLRGHCTVCHIGRGGGERNDFGEAFEDAGYRITPKLRAKFPELFEQKATTSAQGG